MKQLKKFLKVFFFVQLGACAGRVLAKYLDYVNRKALYEAYSAPWYTGILLTLILTAISAALTAVAYFVVCYIIKKRRDNE